MEQILNFILNPYLYIFLSAFIIMGLTQLIKLIPVFKDNNWNVSFPVLFGYIAAFIWAILTKFEIQTQIQILLAFGAGIGALSVTLYGIIKKVFDKEYRLEKKIEDSDLYKFLNNLLSNDIKDFNDKTIFEKFNFIKDIALDIKRIVENSNSGDKEALKKQIDITVGKFLSTNTLGESLDNFMALIEKNYKLPLNKEVKKEETTNEIKTEEVKTEIVVEENKGDIE